MPRKKTHEEFVNEVYEKYGNEYIVLGKYIKKQIPIKMMHNCEYCGNYGEKGEWKIQPNKFLSRNDRAKIPCPVCNGSIKTTYIFKREVYEKYGSEYTVLGEYIDNKTKIRIRHNNKKCNFYDNWYILPNNILNGNNIKCPVCNKNADKNTEIIKIQIANVVGGEYTVLGEYINNTIPILIKHNSKLCDYNEYLVYTNDFINKGRNRCPICNSIKQSSIAEEELYEYIKSIYNKEIIRNDRIILNGKELDIYLPDANIAIEYNGCYWHSINKHDNKYHLNKYNLCKEKDITLITVWEDNYEKNKDKYYNIIYSFINNEPVYDTIYKDNLIYINKDYEDLENIIYDDESDKYYKYIGDTIPELINRDEFQCWNIGYKIYKEI